MKKFQLYILPIILFLCSAGIFGGLFYVLEDAKSLRALSQYSKSIKTEVDSVRLTQTKAEDILRTSNIIDGLSMKNNLGLSVITNKEQIIVLKRVSDEGSKYEFLGSYQSIFNFLDQVKSLPVNLEIDSFCFGLNCAQPLMVVYNVLPSPGFQDMGLRGVR